MPHRKTKSMRTAYRDFPPVLDNSDNSNSGLLLLFLSEKSETKRILYHYPMPFLLDAVLSG